MKEVHVLWHVQCLTKTWTNLVHARLSYNHKTRWNKFEKKSTSVLL